MCFGDGWRLSVQAGLRGALPAARAVAALPRLPAHAGGGAELGRREEAMLQKVRHYFVLGGRPQGYPGLEPFETRETRGGCSVTRRLVT